MARTSKLPNIVMIISDDQGYWAMGCAGNDEIITPNLDKLAKEGIRFNQFFCASPVCSPARASLFTGKIPSQHGIHDWICKGHVDEEEISKTLREKFYLEDKAWQYEWPTKQLKGAHAIRYLEGQKCFTEILSEQGYTCGLSGKWHLGDSGKAQAGFSYWQTLAMGGDNYYYPTVLEAGQFVMKEKVYVTDYITEKALTFLDEQKDKESPFYLSVHYTAPHSPWEKHQHPEEVYKLYEDCPFDSIPKEAPHPWSGVTYENEGKQESIRQKNLKGYFTAVTAMDKSIGELVEKLEKENLLENTIIFFTADNGMSMGHHGIYGKGNGTFPMNMYDTAVKVPMIMASPFLKNKGIVNEDLLSHYDILPTLLTYLGFEKEIPKDLPGKSFTDLLEGKPKLDLEEEKIVIMDEYGPTRMIRTKEWKYIHRYPYGPHELYHLKEDPDEKYNLIDTHIEKREELRAKLNEWFLRYVDPSKDGKGEAVRGIGQKNKVGCENKGKEPFRQSIKD